MKSHSNVSSPYRRRLEALTRAKCACQDANAVGKRANLSTRAARSIGNTMLSFGPCENLSGFCIFET